MQLSSSLTRLQPASQQEASKAMTMMTVESKGVVSEHHTISQEEAASTSKKNEDEKVFTFLTS
jgi:hypothetical protein